MFDVPTPDAEERRDNATFRAVLVALARPGLVQTLPEPGALTVARALIDRECRASADETGVGDALAALGAAVVPLELADHAILRVADAAAVERFARLPIGDALHPERGATAILAGRIGDGRWLRLRGPGIERTREIALGGMHETFWAARKAACRYPLGVDLLVVDGERLLGLPRSTEIEVL